MTTPYSVHIPEQLKADLAPALASLPKSVHTTGRIPADIHVVDGRDGDWPAHVLREHERGASSIYVHLPRATVAGLDDAETVAAVIPVLLNQPLAGNPSVPTITSDTLRRIGAARLLTAIATVAADDPTDLEAAALDALSALLHPLTPESAPNVIAATTRPSSVSIAGRAGEVPIRVTVTASNTPRTAELSWHGSNGTIVAVIPDRTSAAPAEVTVTDKDGALLLPTVYETSDRATLRRLVTALQDGTLPSDIIDHAAASTMMNAPVSSVTG